MFCVTIIIIHKRNCFLWIYEKSLYLRVIIESACKWSKTCNRIFLCYRSIAVLLLQCGSAVWFQVGHDVTGIVCTNFSWFYVSQVIFRLLPFPFIVAPNSASIIEAIFYDHNVFDFNQKIPISSLLNRVNSFCIFFFVYLSCFRSEPMSSLKQTVRPGRMIQLYVKCWMFDLQVFGPKVFCVSSLQISGLGIEALLGSTAQRKFGLTPGW